ncbi:serine--tRNA ligase [Candidatus Nomurabacteria bacterium RIFCSPLOWO2_01_FULL_39_18]|uniref:Serine--tRNA ligase n=1 Tax=Candidatus Nomurabacteria bacterium RIFCSPHIGHO2_01_FULL_40_24b TaxID=1801739 RepID=A0A1F6V6G3_9BACT|nr:MAG: serine--tRNA ligase [Candidatus Nomurabacteria bacterium RIFCSPHIGHO2_01_FULL_40_24b]OGI89210.1 MAG: serine--tRNA ligase [Candidatus Nomurabacteria bacterium RIFCSPLOWO2_01_FULL_39_18]
MLDIKFIRENKDIVQGGAKQKHVEIDIEKLTAVDDERLKILKEVEELRGEINKVSNNIARDQNPALKLQLIEEMRVVKEDLKTKEEKLKTIMDEWRQMMLQVPNVPDMTVPEGKGEEDNKEVLTWGEKTKFDFTPKDHVELMLKLNMVDFERGVKVHGFRGYFLKQDGAELSWAIWNYARDFFGAKNFIPFIAPAVVHKQHLYGTGHLPGGAEDIYQTQDGDYLSGTAEIPMMGYHSGEIIPREELPKRYLAFSPCFRREAGAHGKDTKGLIRVQEFFKLEQLILCEASHEESVKYHEEINKNYEEFIESLGIPYRRLEICTGDLKSAHVKSYDTEAWIPSQNQYRELSSASYYHDFQSRRFNIRYKDKEGNSLFVHSLNSTAVATPRILVAIVENFQQTDGSVKIPEVLRKYMGGKEFIT